MFLMKLKNKVVLKKQYKKNKMTKSSQINLNKYQIKKKKNRKKKKKMKE